MGLFDWGYTRTQFLLSVSRNRYGFTLAGYRNEKSATEPALIMDNGYQDIIGQGHYGKIKLQNQGHTMTMHLQPPTSVATKYQLPTPYGCRNTVWTRYYRSRSLQQNQRSNLGHTMMMHT